MMVRSPIVADDIGRAGGDEKLLAGEKSHVPRLTVSEMWPERRTGFRLHEPFGG
jgi:hypothetical protein